MRRFGLGRFGTRWLRAGRRVGGCFVALGLALPTNVAAHQLDAASASLWERALHLFTSADHVVALAGALVVAALLVWRVRGLRRRGSGAVDGWEHRKAQRV